ncbi:Auxin-induced protein 5NG4 [Glycine soja]|uniref:Auxin-induced protein 5NG4 n=1 Tax=Glycine soja TaxID=3848 RepID=A0A0B2STN6_GLYSO|nr:hypothetical protein JHK87_006876 [Glycine soja]KAG5071827.1 hypothetical protein JHK86_007038 [Glycine max]KHN47884.1 Auxin-induced protein 5NG4 [Glycine soja]
MCLLTKNLLLQFLGNFTILLFHYDGRTTEWDEFEWSKQAIHMSVRKQTKCPLMMIIVAIMGAFILAEKIYLGGVIGAILIVMGLYSVLWGKHKENKEKEAEITIELLKCCSENGMTLETVVEDAETNNDIDMQKGEASRELRVAIVVPKV